MVIAPPAPGRVRIIDRTRVLSADPARIGKYDDIIVFMDEAMRTHMVTIPSEELINKTEEEQVTIILNRIKALMEERARWIGRELGIR